MPVISTNLAANSAVRYLNINSALQTSSLSKLASGSRITQASDDAAGLAISTKISSDVTALNQAATNASHGISVLQTADGGASNISDILQRMKALASQASSGTVTDNERVYIDAEFQQLIQEIDAISTGSRYNGQSLLDGTSAFAAGINVMVGSDAADIIKVALDKLTSQGLGLKTTDGIADTGVKGNEDAQVDAQLVLTLPVSMTTGDVLSFKINGIDLTITGAAGVTNTGVLATDQAAMAAQVTAALAAAVGEDFTAVVAAGTITFSAAAGSFGEGKLQVTDASNNNLTDAAAVSLGFDKGLSQGTGGVSGTPAQLIIDSTVGLADGATLAFRINGIDLSITNDSGGAWVQNDIAAALATRLAAVDGEDFVITQAAAGADIVITSAAEGGQLTVTNATGGALTTGELNALAMSTDAAWVPGDAVTGVDAGTYGTVNDSPAFLNGTSTGVTITEDKVTFEVNNVTVTLTNTGGAGANGVYTAQELADTINAALIANNVTNVTASIRAGALSIASTTLGSEAKVEVDNFSSGTSKSILGMDPVATGVKAAEGQGTALKFGVQTASSQNGAILALDVVDKAIAQVSKARANIGSLESRFGFHQASIATSVENLTAAVSAIRDTDVAQEAARLASVKVKTQAAVAAAAQASQMPQDLLKLLQ